MPEEEVLQTVLLAPQAVKRMLELITCRRSAAALVAPGPDDRQLAAILAAGRSVFTGRRFSATAVTPGR